MANQTLSNVTILLRNDTASNWTTENPVLSKGEIGVEIDTNKFKFGDGIKTWSNLDYAGTVVSSSSTNGKIKIDGVDTTVYTLPIGSSTIGGVKTTASGAGTVAIDSNGAMALNTVSGLSAGDYTKVTVDTHGVVTAGANLSATDIPTITLAKISDAGTAAAANTGTSSGNVPVLDSNGKLNTSVLPALAITDTFTAASQAAMLALSAQKGDICVRTDTNEVYILTVDGGASTLSNWTQINVPSGGVTSVNTKTGVVTLGTDDIAEGSTNLYYTDTRFNTAFASKASSGLTDGSTILHSTDTLTLDCGNA